MHLLYGGRGAALWRRDMEGGDQKAPRKQKGGVERRGGTKLPILLQLGPTTHVHGAFFSTFSSSLLLASSSLPLLFPLFPPPSSAWWILWKLLTFMTHVHSGGSTCKRRRIKLLCQWGIGFSFPHIVRYVYSLKHCCPLCVHPPDTNIYIHRFIMKRRTTMFAGFKLKPNASFCSLAC